MTPSASVSEALTALERQLDRTVDDLVNRSTKVIGGALTGVHDEGPAEIRKAWDTLNEKFYLKEFGGKLARIGLRAFRGALALLARIVPGKWLAGIRASVDQLIMNVDERGPGKAVVGAVIGADRLTDRTRFDQSTLDMAKLDRGTAELTELATKYGKMMDLCGGIGTAIGLAAKFSAVLRLAIPQLGLLIMGAHVLVIGSVIVLGRDHVDAGLDPRRRRTRPGTRRTHDRHRSDRSSPVSSSLSRAASRSSPRSMSAAVTVLHDRRSDRTSPGAS